MSLQTPIDQAYDLETYIFEISSMELHVHNKSVKKCKSAISLNIQHKTYN